MTEPKAGDDPVASSIQLVDTDNLQPVEQVEEIVGTVYSYVQTVPATIWLAGHSLGRPPTQIVVTPVGDPVECEVTANATNINVTFPDLRTGKIEFI